MQKALNVVIIAILLSNVFFVFPNSTYAQAKNSYQKEVVPSPTPSPSSESSPPTEFDRFTTFWPLVAGKTKGDSLYSLKRVKEWLRGIFIFGKHQKAEYEVFLGVKRVLEADSLIQSGKIDLASKTLDDAIMGFDKAKNLANNAKNDPSVSGSIQEMKNNLANINKLLEFLMGQKAEPSNKIKEAKEKATALEESL